MAAPRRHDEGGASRGEGPGIDRIMTSAIACVGERATLAELRELLVERGQHCVPVLGAEGRPVGMVTQTDLLRASGEGSRTAGDIMTALVFALPITASVEQAAALMAYEGVEQIVVTGMNGEVAGVVRALDVARRCARSAGYLVDREE
jgi:CBS domain-containing protein